MKAKSLRNTATYQKLWGGAVVDPGEGPEGPAPLNFSIKMRPEEPKTFFWRLGAPTYLRVWMTAPSPPPYLKVWIRHGGVPSTLLLYDGGGYDFACTSEVVERWFG